MGIAGTLARYFNKLVHRFVVESPKLFSTSFWIQILGVLYLAYIFQSYWFFGLLQSWFLKLDLLFTNTLVFALLKVVMIESSQSTIIRDLAMINFAFACYILAYPFAGYPWITFLLYVGVVFERVLCVHFTDQLSPELHNSIGILFNDPENLDELVRLNINDQLEDTID